MTRNDASEPQQRPHTEDRAKRVPKVLRPFRSVDYRILMVAMSMSLFGSGMWAVAMVYEVIALGGDEVAVAVVGTATASGLIATAILGGIAADRLPRRWILRTVELLNLLAVGFSATLGMLGQLQVWHLAITGAALGIATGFFFPAYSASLPRILAEDELLAANGIEGMGRPVLTQALGPAVAGYITAAIAPEIAIMVIVGAHALAFIALWFLHPRVDTDDVGTSDSAALNEHSGSVVLPVTGAILLPPLSGTGEVSQRQGSASARTSVWQDLREAVKYVVGTPWLAWTLGWSAFILFFYLGPLEVLTPFLIREQLGLGSDAFASVLAGFGIGAAVGSLVISSFPLPKHYLTVMLSLWGLPLALFGLFGFVGNLWIIVALAFVIGATGGAGTVIWGTLLQRRVPRRMLGRVSSLDFFVSLALMPLSTAIAGPVGKLFPVEWVFATVGAVTVAATIFVLAFAGLRKDELDHPIRDDAPKL